MKKIIASIAVFFTTFLIYHIGFGCRVFPVDETTNTLQAPAWYPIIGIALAAGVAVLFSRRKAILFKIKLKVNPKAASEDLLGIRKQFSNHYIKNSVDFKSLITFLKGASNWRHLYYT